MAVKRVVSTSFWTDSKVDMFSPEDKYFMLYLLTNPHTTQLGIYELPKKHAAFELGYSQESVAVLLDRFETKYGIIKRSKETSEIAIKNYLKHSVMKGGKPVLDCLNKELSEVKDLSLVKFVCDANRSNGNATVREFIENTISQYLNNNENDNDNDNERIVDESYPESSKPTSAKKTKRFVKPTVAEVAAYCAERNNGIDAQYFVDYYEVRGWCAGKAHMKDWKAAVRTWESNNKKRNAQNRYSKQNQPMPTAADYGDECF